MYYELTNITVFYGAITFFVLIFFIWKNRDAHFLLERNDILSVKDRSKPIPTSAKLHHTWWHNFGFIFNIIIVIGFVVFALGATWQGFFLGLTVGALFMVMDIVLNMKMKSAGWTFWHLAKKGMDKYLNWYVRFALLITGIGGFHLTEYLTFTKMESTGTEDMWDLLSLDVVDRKLFILRYGNPTNVDGDYHPFGDRGVAVGDEITY